MGAVRETVQRPFCRKNSPKPLTNRGCIATIPMQGDDGTSTVFRDFREKRKG